MVHGSNTVLAAVCLQVTAYEVSHAGHMLIDRLDWLPNQPMDRIRLQWSIVVAQKIDWQYYADSAGSQSAYAPDLESAAVTWRGHDKGVLRGQRAFWRRLCSSA